MLDKYTVLLFFLVVAENQYSCEVGSIIRSNVVYGDMLTGVGLNCAKYGLTKLSNSSCYCGQYQTFYTNDAEETKCYSGIGDELGCSLYAVDSKFIHIMKLEPSTIDVKLFGQTCLEHFTLTRMHTWINDEWLLYSFKNWSKDLFPQLLVKADNKTTKLLFDSSNPNKYKGALMRISYNVCGQFNCLLIKFAGSASYSPKIFAPFTNISPSSISVTKSLKAGKTLSVIDVISSIKTGHQTSVYNSSTSGNTIMTITPSRASVPQATSFVSVPITTKRLPLSSTFQSSKGSKSWLGISQHGLHWEIILIIVIATLFCILITCLFFYCCGYARRRWKASKPVKSKDNPTDWPFSRYRDVGENSDVSNRSVSVQTASSNISGSESGKSSPSIPINQQSLTRQQLAEELYGDGIVPSKIQLTPNTPYASRSKIYVTTSSPNFTRNVNCLIPNADINTQRNVTIDSDIQYTGINLDDLYY